MKDKFCDNPYCTVGYDPEKKICQECEHNKDITEKLEDNDIYNFLFGGKK